MLKTQPKPKLINFLQFKCQYCSWPSSLPTCRMVPSIAIFTPKATAIQSGLCFNTLIPHKHYTFALLAGQPSQLFIFICLNGIILYFRSLSK